MSLSRSHRKKLQSALPQDPKESIDKLNESIKALEDFKLKTVEISIELKLTAEEFDKAIREFIDEYDKAMARVLCPRSFEPMARIPEAVRVLSGATGDPRALRQILVAALLYLQRQQGDEEEPIILKEEDLKEAWNYTLVVNDIGEEGAIVLSVRPK